MNEQGYVYYSGGRWKPNAVTIARLIFERDCGLTRRALATYPGVRRIYTRCGGALALDAALDQLIERGLIRRNYIKAARGHRELYVPRLLGDCAPYIVRCTTPSNTVPEGMGKPMSSGAKYAANAASEPPHSGGVVS